VRISPETIAHVATLGRLHLDAEELAEFAKELEAILEYMDKLAELDTEAVEPTAHVVEGAGHWREDRVESWAEPDLLLENAPERMGRQFKVPRIIE